MRSHKAKTLKDVATASGFSVATVSRVAQSAGGVNLSTAVRVREAAAKLGFDLNRADRARAIAFVLSNRAILHPFHSCILSAAESHCSAQGWDVIFQSHRYALELSWKNLCLPGVLARRGIVRGVILAGTNSQGFVDLLHRKRLPFVALGNNLIGKKDNWPCDTVYSDDARGAFDMTRHLISLGHSHIWFVGNCRLPWFARCYEGYRRAMEVTKLVPRLSDIDAYDDETLGYVSAKSILCRGELVTAIFGGTDATAQGVYKALKEYRLSIPDDVSVVGCNDTFARLLDPPLTTIREFPDLIGKRLAELLLERISSPDIPPRVVTVPTQLARNESSGPVSLPVGDANLQIRNALEMRGSKPNSE